MVEQQVKPALQFSGSKREQALAEKIMGLILARGMFMSANAPIKLSLGSLAEFLDSQGEKDSRARIDVVIEANPTVFAIEEMEGDPYLVTTRDGRAPQVARAETRHTFASRFHTPLPKPEAAAPRPRPRQETALVDILAGMDELQVDEQAVKSEAQPAAVEERTEEAPAAVARTITTQAIKPTEVTEVDDVNLAVALRERLGADPRVANFGELWLMEDRVPRFSRGDLRRLRDYMQEK